MKIDIRTRGFSLTPGLRRCIERRLALALDRYEERVTRVRVTLGDVNGPKGGKDKSCHVDVGVKGGRTVHATELEGDAYVALDLAVRRAARSVARTLDRARPTIVQFEVNHAAAHGMAFALARGRSRAPDVDHDWARE